MRESFYKEPYTEKEISDAEKNEKLVPINERLQTKKEQLEDARKKFNEHNDEYEKLEKYGGTITKLEGRGNLRYQARTQVEQLEGEIRALEGQVQSIENEKE